MKQVSLSQGKYALVDDDDYETLSRHKWCAQKAPSGKWYAIRNDRGKKIYMHRTILGIENGGVRVEVDHIDLDGLNNQRSNLRRATPSQNKANRPKTQGCSSAYKGVDWVIKDRRWRARIKTVDLGNFKSEQDAARAYDAKAIEMFGEFAYTNFPLDYVNGRMK